MYESSIKYPDLGIVHIKIDCVETSDKAGTIQKRLAKTGEAAAKFFCKRSVSGRFTRAKRQAVALASDGVVRFVINIWTCVTPPQDKFCVLWPLGYPKACSVDVHVHLIALGNNPPNYRSKIPLLCIHTVLIVFNLLVPLSTSTPTVCPLVDNHSHCPCLLVLVHVPQSSFPLSSSLLV